MPGISWSSTPPPPRAIDRDGGYFQAFRDDGSIYDTQPRHLISSTRVIFNYAMASIEFQQSEYLEATRHGLRFLREKRRNAETGGYRWILEGDRVIDDTNHCYGLAFLLLAYATALKAGIAEASDWLVETNALMEAHFWSPGDGLYRDEISADWRVVSPYRGQNTNMHG